jgi:acyl-CoA reductase-like NAD-dependent aldehyde dehydrogenase
MTADPMSPQNMVEAALASSARVRRAAEAVIDSARETCAAANHVIVHRQLIGELREAVRAHYSVSEEASR